MFKVFWLLKRKPGLSHEQFRAHYESSHSQLAQRWFGHLLTGYHRNYVTGAEGSTLDEQGGTSFGAVAFGYDCIAEWIMADEAAFDEIRRILAQPEVRRIFSEDEERFLDRTSFRLVRCDVVDNGTGDGRLTLGGEAVG